MLYLTSCFMPFLLVLYFPSKKSCLRIPLKGSIVCAIDPFFVGFMLGKRLIFRYDMRMKKISGICDSLADCIGNTPLLRLHRVTNGVNAEILLKCEFCNPLFSIKDRVAASMIAEAEVTGQLKPGSLIIEPTSGNTGIGLAFVAKAKGYRCLLVMPETMSIERRALLGMLGAEIVLTPGALAMSGALEKAKQLCGEYGDMAFMPDQFSNPNNPLAHYRTTGPELVEATEGKIDVFVASIGTGGTIDGIGRYLKEHIPGVQVIGVEPAESAVISGGKPGAHKIQGIGAGFIPSILDVSLLDEVMSVTSDDAIQMARRLNGEEGIPVGISSGCNVQAAMMLARRPEYEGKRIVTVASSAVERYMSTILVQQVKEKVMNIQVNC